MAITRRALHLPPYISTSWQHVVSLHMEQDEEEGPILVVTLVNGTQILVPALEEPVVRQIFAVHAKVLEAEQSTQEPSIAQVMTKRTPTEVVADELETMMEHTPSQADAPPLPRDLLDRVQQLGKLMGADFVVTLPQPEPGCNCCHCQVHRALHHGLAQQAASASAPPVDEQASGSDWTIQSEEGSTAFHVIRGSDESVSYLVTLGESISCSCGQPGCEHIRAVLMS
ncbi:MAG: hypothetical protein ACOYKZ_01225 [Chlamydiia bacterium]